MFAVIKTGGKQYRVSPDDVIRVEKLAGEAGDMIEIADVLMVGDGDTATVGTPTVDGALVTAEIVALGRGRKVIAFKKRRRQNSKRTRGHRQWHAELRISEILTGGAKPSKKAAAKKPAPAKEEAKPEAKAEPEAKKTSKKTAAPAAEAPATEAPKAAAPMFTAPEGAGDDLTKVKGIGPVAMKQLNEQGITTYAQLAALTDEDVQRIDEAMPFSADQISDWREQAQALAAKA